MMKINLGCGLDYKKGWTNIDVPPTKCDVKHDLNKYPYPFKSSSVDYIFAKWVCEHLDDMEAFIKEAYRILKTGGLLEIIVPNFSDCTAFEDVQHRQYFTPFTFHIYDKRYSEQKCMNRTYKAEFKVERNDLIFYSLISPFKGKICGLIFNSCRQTKTLYNQTFLHNLFPRTHIRFTLRKEDNKKEREKEKRRKITVHHKNKRTTLWAGQKSEQKTKKTTDPAQREQTKERGLVA